MTCPLGFFSFGLESSLLLICSNLLLYSLLGRDLVLLLFPLRRRFVAGQQRNSRRMIDLYLLSTAPSSLSLP